MGVGGQCHALATLIWERDPVPIVWEAGQAQRAGVDRCRKSCPHRDSIPGPSNP